MLRSLFEGSTRDEQVETQYLLLYVYKIIRLLLFDIIVTYFLGLLMYIVSNELNPANEPDTFIERFGLKEMTVYNRAVRCVYFILTTLTTAGYGDFYPITKIERVYVIGVQLFGVAFYSYIMGNFIEIISNYDKKMGVVDRAGDLQNWLTLLTRFTNNKPLDKKIVQEIEDHFQYFWSQYKLTSITPDDPYLACLSKSTRREVTQRPLTLVADNQVLALGHLLRLQTVLRGE
jgi:hypothetical protein